MESSVEYQMKKLIKTFALMVCFFYGLAFQSNAGNAGTIIEKVMPEQVNPYPSLFVPTYVTNIDDTWFIVDCYHDQILFSERISEPLCNWKTLTTEVNKPHTIAGDGEVYLVDDTDNNRVLVFQRTEEGFVNTQIFENVGKRPHHTVYDDETGCFYVWSSLTGEMYTFENEEGLVFQKDIMRVNDGTPVETSMLDGAYIRSFYICGSDIYLVSGLRGDETATGIVVCDKHNMTVKEIIDVPDELAGMASIRKDGNTWFITVSTDVHNDQSAATMISVQDLHFLKNHEYEIIYQNFIGGGTPYSMTQNGSYIYLTEHRLPGYCVWRYRIDEDGSVTQVEKMF